MAAERLGGRRVEVGDDLLARLAGVCPVATADAVRVEHGRDWWPLALRWGLAGDVAALPAAVAAPTTTAGVAAVLALCHQARVPVTPAAGRSGVCGGAVPVHGGVALDLRGVAGVTDVDDRSLVVEAGAGTNGADLEAALGARGLTLGHRPQSLALSSVGGWLACRSAGQYSTRYGKIEDMVVGLEVVLADGQVIHTGGAAPRAATGPDLSQVFVGSEGTLGVITAAALRVRPDPPARRRAAFGFASFAEGLDACRRVLRRGATPAVLRLHDSTESQRGFGVEGRNVLIVLDEAEPRLADAVLHLVGEECAGAERLDDALVDAWMAGRDDVSALGALLADGMTVDTCEVAARWSALPAVHGAAVAALGSVRGTHAVSAHQSHAYADGACIYLTFVGRRDGGDDSYYVDAWDAVVGAVLAAGGNLAHHHGVGLNRARFLPRALGPAFATLVGLKAALDPRGILNPGKLGLPSPWGAPAWP